MRWTSRALGAGALSIVLAHAGPAGAQLFTQIPLDDPLGGPPYMGTYELGLFPGGNELPPQHYAEGIARANAVVPLDANGNPDPVNGMIVLMSLGMSNTAGPWCNLNGYIPVIVDATGRIPCQDWTFMGRARNAGTMNAINPRMRNFAGAFVAQPAVIWIDDNAGPMVSIPGNPNLPVFYGTYTRLRDYFMPIEQPIITEAQVQILWIKQLNPAPTVSLPAADADANILADYVARILRFAKTRYPNLRMAFVTGAGYRGWNTNGFGPEPMGYETGFAYKRLIAAQINQVASDGAVVDPLIGDLDYRTGVAPWVTWGPYLWASNSVGRNSDGLSWVPTEYVNDYVHLLQTGISKLGLMLHHFFTFSPFTHCWFVGDGPCQ